MIRDNKIWLGFGFKGGAGHFINAHYEDYATAGDHKDGMIRVSGVHWFTNLDIAKRHEDVILYKKYTKKDYPKYKNYDAIEVAKFADIPVDYSGAMGVPITFLDKYNSAQFEIIGSSMTLGKRMSEIADKDTYSQGGPRFYLDNGNGTYRRLYDRLVIKNKKL